jgi:hypothetical protein
MSLARDIHYFKKKRKRIEHFEIKEENKKI